MIRRRKNRLPGPATPAKRDRTLAINCPTPSAPATGHDDDATSRCQSLADESGATTLEWALLLAAVAIPSYWLIQIALAYLIDLYRMQATLNALPFP